LAASQPGIFSQMVITDNIENDKFINNLYVVQQDSNNSFYTPNTKLLITYVTVSNTPKVAFVPDALQEESVSKRAEVQNYGLNELKSLLESEFKEIKMEDRVISLKEKIDSDADYLLYVDFQVKDSYPRIGMVKEKYDPKPYVIISIWGKNDEKITQFITRFNRDDVKFMDMFKSKSYKPAGLFEKPIYQAVEFIKLMKK
jgi:hypothetical protein